MLAGVLDLRHAGILYQARDPPLSAGLLARVLAWVLDLRHAGLLHQARDPPLSAGLLAGSDGMSDGMSDSMGTLPSACQPLVPIPFRFHAILPTFTYLTSHDILLEPKYASLPSDGYTGLLLLQARDRCVLPAAGLLAGVLAGSDQHAGLLLRHDRERFVLSAGVSAGPLAGCQHRCWQGCQGCLQGSRVQYAGRASFPMHSCIPSMRVVLCGRQFAEEAATSRRKTEAVAAALQRRGSLPARLAALLAGRDGSHLLAHALQVCIALRG